MMSAMAIYHQLTYFSSCASSGMTGVHEVKKDGGGTITPCTQERTPAGLPGRIFGEAPSFLENVTANMTCRTAVGVEVLQSSISFLVYLRCLTVWIAACLRVVGPSRKMASRTTPELVINTETNTVRSSFGNCPAAGHFLCDLHRRRMRSEKCRPVIQAGTTMPYELAYLNKAYAAAGNFINNYAERQTTNVIRR